MFCQTKFVPPYLKPFWHGYLEKNDKCYDAYRQYQSQTFIEYDQRELVTEVKLANDGNGTGMMETDFIDNIIYINLDTSTDRNNMLLAQLRQQNFSRHTKIFRLNAIRDQDRVKACYLSHMHALSWAAQHCQGNVLILEDDFQFQLSVAENQKYMQSIKDLRWDVIHFGQYVHAWQRVSHLENPKVFRALHSTTGSGYLIHADYIDTLTMKFHEALQQRIGKAKFDNNDCQDQLQIHIQQRDFWIAFDQPIGGQSLGVSTIGHSTDIVHNTWACDKTCTFWMDSEGRQTKLRSPAKPITIKRIAVIFNFSQHAPNVIHHLQRTFLKPHTLTIHIFQAKVCSASQNVIFHDGGIDVTVLDPESYDFVFQIADNLWCFNSLPSDDILSSSSAIVNRDETFYDMNVYRTDFFGAPTKIFIENYDSWSFFTHKIPPSIVIENKAEQYFKYF